MSALTGVSSSSISYATQLAQTSTFERSLYNLGTAIQNGNLTGAGSILTGLMQSNPQYASDSGSSTQTQDPINQDFQNIASAISSNQPDAAKTAWAQLKTDLAKNGVSNISSGADLAAQAVAQNKLSMEQTLLGSLFGTNSNGGVSAGLLLGVSDGTGATSDPVSAVVSNWLSYQANGSSSTQPSISTPGNGLNTVA
jgi:hypothetical protein